MCSENKDTKQGEISSVSGSLIYPIAALCSELEINLGTGKSLIRAATRENGYALSLIVLMVILIEAILNRVKYLKNKNKTGDNLEFFKKEFIDRKGRKLKNKLLEVYIARDLIVHNHIWIIKYRYNKKFSEIEIKRNIIRSIYGDKKYKNNISKRNYCTKNLKINIIPTKIGKGDVIKVMKVVKELIEFLESKNSTYCLINNNCKYKGKLKKFYDILDVMIKSSTNV